MSNRIILWNNELVANGNISASWRCISSGFNYNNHINATMLNSTTVRIIAKDNVETRYVRIAIGTYQPGNNNRDFFYKAFKGKFNFESATYYVNSELNGSCSLFVDIQYELIDGTQLYQRSNTNKVITILPEDNFEQCIGCTLWIDLGKTVSFTTDSYIDIKNLQIELEDAEIIKNNHSLVYNPIILNTGKYLIKYSNTDCLNSVGSFCATFNGSSDYIDFGTRISGKAFSLTITNTDITSSGYIVTCMYNPIISLYFTLRKINETLYIGFSATTEDYTFRPILNFSLSADTIYNIYIDTSHMASGVDRENLIIKINDINYSLGTSTSSGTPGLGKTGINCGYNSSTSTLITSTFKGSICDFKIYDGNSITHWYPLTEGLGTIAHDVIGTVNGAITASPSFWTNIQDIFTYTIDNRFTPVNYKARISNNNCATFNGSSDGIFLSQASIIDTDNCVISFDFRMPTSISHNIVFFQGIIKNDNDFSSGTAYGWHFYMRTSTEIILCRPDGKKQNLRTHTELLDNKPHRFELTINGPSSPASLKIDNVSVITGSDSGSFKDTGRSYIGVGNESGSTLMDYYVGSIWNFKISDQNDNLIHWYPLAEGSNIIAYDAVGGVNGRIVSTSLSTFWGTKQDAFAYNAINGFKEDSNQATALSTAKVPLSKDICIYKSNFISSVDGWSSYGSSFAYSYSNNALIITRNESSSTSGTIHNSNGFNISQLGTNFHIYAKVKNLCAVPITRIMFCIGSVYASDGLAYLDSNNLNIKENEEYIINSDTTIEDGGNFSDVIRIIIYYESAINPSVCSISDIEITQINNTITYSIVANGIPPCESSIDFSQGISNIAELRNIMAKPITSFTTYDMNEPVYAKILEDGSLQNLVVYKNQQSDINLLRIKNHLI